jgi:hypothetical protein
VQISQNTKLYFEENDIFDRSRIDWGNQNIDTIWALTFGKFK